MEYIKDFAKIQTRLDLLLHGEILDRCCVAVTAPKDPKNPYVNRPEGSESWYMDGERILARNLERLDKMYFAGDALPMVFPYFGTGGHAKYFNDDVDVVYAPDTIWIHPYLESCADLRPADLSRSRFFAREMEIMRYLASESRGRYLLGMPDNCGSYDALAQLRGNEPLLMDFLDEPEAVKRAARLCVDCLKESCEAMFETVRGSCMGGSVHGWMNLLSKGKIMQLQCDLAVMLSPDMFGEFIMEELRSTMDFLDNGVYHIDGREQVRHLDHLLSEPRINMCQWVSVAGQPPLIENVPTLRRIQQAGKGLVIQLSKAEIKSLMQAISPKGVILLVSDADSPEEADDIVRYVERATVDSLKNGI